MRAVRVLTGEYRGAPNDPEPWLTVGGVAELAAALGPVLQMGPDSAAGLDVGERGALTVSRQLQAFDPAQNDHSK